MNLLRWTVQVNYDPGRFFVPVTTSVYLSGISLDDGRSLVAPQFSAINPVLYRRSYARFIVKELRRSGYNARKRPYFIFAIRQRRLKKKQSAWK